MDHFKNFTNFLLEYQNKDIQLIESLNNYFTIGFEIELNTTRRSYPIPPKIITKESKLLKTPSIQDRKKIMDLKKNFPIFFRKYFDMFSFHYDETVSMGIEIVTTPFKNVDDAKEFLTIFFDEYNKQKDWFFDDKTSIHINIGLNQKGKWKPLKGIILLSDDVIFKNIESRKISGFCKNIKNDLFYYLKSVDPEITKTYDIKKIENRLDYAIYDMSKSITEKTYGINLWKFYNSSNKYLEFRFIGGDVNLNITLDKMLYFLYVVYLMTSKYKQKEYYNKLFIMVDKVRTKQLDDIESLKKKDYKSVVKKQYKNKPIIP